MLLLINEFSLIFYFEERIKFGDRSFLKKYNTREYAR